MKPRFERGVRTPQSACENRSHLKLVRFNWNEGKTFRSNSACFNRIRKREIPKGFKLPSGHPLDFFWFGWLMKPGRPSRGPIDLVQFLLVTFWNRFVALWNGEQTVQCGGQSLSWRIAELQRFQMSIDRHSAGWLLLIGRVRWLVSRLLMSFLAVHLVKMSSDREKLPVESQVSNRIRFSFACFTSAR